MRTLQKVETIIAITIFTIIEMMFVTIGFAYLVCEIMYEFEVAAYFIVVIPYIYIKVRNLVFKLRDIVRA